MIRSSKVTLKFANVGKRDKLNAFITEYQRVTQDFVNLLWEETDVKPLVSKEFTSQVKTWLSARAVQCSAKQASGIVRGTRVKQSRRLYQINRFKSSGCFKKARALQKIYDKAKVSRPDLKTLECELDERFVKIRQSGNSYEWVELSSLGNKLKLAIPFKKHEHFNRLSALGEIKVGVRLGRNSITFAFDIPDTTKRLEGKALGIDIGQSTTLSCSDGQTLNACPHGHTYDSICKKLARKKKGSKSFERAVAHRSNYLKYLVKRLNLDGVKIVNRENIRGLRKFSRVSRRMAHWNYAELVSVLDNELEKRGVLVNRLNPAFTSQRCSACGWTRKRNRKGKLFKCEKCSYEHDADLNAAQNLSLVLSPLGKDRRDNKTGFYWRGQEPIVPGVQEAFPIFQ